jgi:molybdenum ABC transporter molybdate-binding protein
MRVVIIDKIKILKNSFFKKAIFFIVIAVGILPGFEASAKNYVRSLTIVAEPNMVYALTKIARIYSGENNVAISVSFDSSDKLIDDIELGEGIDLFISANYRKIKSLKQKASFDVYNSPIIAFDRLLLATSATNPQIPDQLHDKKISITEAVKILGNNDIILMIDGSESFLGQYSKDIIDSMAGSNLKLIIKADDDKNQLIDDLYQGNNYAILLASQIKNNHRLFVVNDPNQDDIGYQALIIAGDNMELTREFVKFLQGNEAKAILSNSGLIVN